MIGIKAFNQDVENCNIKRCPLIERYSINDADDGLKAIDELFADADAVSKQSYVKTNRYRLSLAICAFLFAFFVLHYGNKESNLIITGGCLILISIMYYLNIFSKIKNVIQNIYNTDFLQSHYAPNFLFHMLALMKT